MQQGMYMYFQNFQNAQKIDLLLLYMYVTNDVLICTAGYIDT